MDAILALLMIGLLNSSLVGVGGTMRTGIAWAELDVGIAEAMAESVKGLERELKITKGTMHSGCTGGTVAAASVLEREMAMSAGVMLLRKRMMKGYRKYEEASKIYVIIG